MDQVEEVKSKLDIVEVISQYMPLKRGGRNMKGLCPFHGEKSPSFMVNPELQIYKCFGCGEGGDALSFVMKMEGMEFVEALKLMAERTGVKLNFKGDEKKTEKEEMVAIHELSAEYYHYLLTKHPVGEEAREYLETRKIKDKIIEEFKLGFALPSWDGLYQFLVIKKKKDVGLVERCGLIMESSKRKGQYYDRFRSRVIFPLLDHRGKVVAFGGRILPGSKDMDDSPKYINSPETLIYHKSEMLFGFTQAKKAIREKDRVVVVEGEMDMLSSFAAGVGETVAIKGSALTEQQVEKLSRLTGNLVLSLDADVAGDSATKRGIQIAENKGMNIKVVRISGGKDPDDVARESPGKWIKMVDSAIDIYQFYLDSATTKHDVATVEGKRKVSEEVLPVLNQISNKVIQAFYVRKASEALDVSEDVILKEMGRVGRAVSFESIKVKAVGIKRTREEQLIEEALSLTFIVERRLAEKLVRKILELKWENVQAKVLQEWLDKPNLGVVEFINQLPLELKTAAQEAYVKEWEENLAAKALEEVVEELVELRLRRRIDKIRAEIVSAEASGEEGDLGRLQEEFVGLTRKLKS